MPIIIWGWGCSARRLHDPSWGGRTRRFGARLVHDPSSYVAWRAAVAALSLSVVCGKRGAWDSKGEAVRGKELVEGTLDFPKACMGLMGNCKGGVAG
jgi:hypothetical protein